MTYTRLKPNEDPVIRMVQDVEHSFDLYCAHKGLDKEAERERDFACLKTPDRSEFLKTLRPKLVEHYGFPVRGESMSVMSLNMWMAWHTLLIAHPHMRDSWCITYSA